MKRSLIPKRTSSSNRGTLFQPCLQPCPPPKHWQNISNLPLISKIWEESPRKRSYTQLGHFIWVKTSRMPIACSKTCPRAAQSVITCSTLSSKTSKTTIKTSRSSLLLNCLTRWLSRLITCSILRRSWSLTLIWSNLLSLPSSPRCLISKSPTRRRSSSRRKSSRSCPEAQRIIPTWNRSGRQMTKLSSTWAHQFTTINRARRIDHAVASSLRI